MTFDEALVRLRSSEEFHLVMEAALKTRPYLVPMQPGTEYEKEAGRMMYESGQMNGFDLLYVFLKGKL